MIHETNYGTSQVHICISFVSSPSNLERSVCTAPSVQWHVSRMLPRWSPLRACIIVCTLRQTVQPCVTSSQKRLIRPSSGLTRLPGHFFRTTPKSLGSTSSTSSLLCHGAFLPETMFVLLTLGLYTPGPRCLLSAETLLQSWQAPHPSLSPNSPGHCPLVHGRT